MDDAVIFRGRVLLRLKKHGETRFKVFKKIVKMMGIPREINILYSQFIFNARIDSEGRICFPAYLREKLKNIWELWFWVKVEDNGCRLVEYRDEPQTTLDEFIYSPFNPPPSSKNPRYRSGAGYCSRCMSSYPASLRFCPIHGTMLRVKPRKSRKQLKTSIEIVEV